MTDRSSKRKIGDSDVTTMKHMSRKFVLTAMRKDRESLLAGIMNVALLIIKKQVFCEFCPFFLV